MNTEHKPPRCGFAALIGAPNAGKSTLLNELVGAKVSIVSRKVQTTRALVRGIALEGETQIIFVDTPGIFPPKRRLDRAMVTSAWGGAGTPTCRLLIDVRKRFGRGKPGGPGRSCRRSGRRRSWCSTRSTPSRTKSCSGLAAELNTKGDFAETFMISALGATAPRHS